MKIEGDIYPPPLWRSYLAKLSQCIKFGLIISVALGIDIFGSVGLPNPGFMVYASQNKVSFCLMVFLVGNLIEGQLMSTGAFEVFFNDLPVWSKLESNRFPEPREFLEIIGHQMNFSSPRVPVRDRSPRPSENL